MRRMMVAGELFLLLLCAVPAGAEVLPLTQPAGLGSQLVFYYDTRPGFTTFLNIRKARSFGERVQIDFWGPTFETKVTQTIELSSLGGRVINAGALVDSLGLGAQQGIAIATVVNGVGNPVHFTQALMGNFTVANLATSSAWGAPALARSARRPDDSEPLDGTIVDGTDVVYQTIAPLVLSLGTYYDPQSLAPVEAHGNQVIFVNFKDPTTIGAPVTSGTTTWSLVANRGEDGQSLVSAAISVSDVSEFDVATLLGSGANGASGGALFVNGGFTPGLSRMIFFVQTLGTFGTGCLLPAR